MQMSLIEHYIYCFFSLYHSINFTISQSEFQLDSSFNGKRHTDPMLGVCMPFLLACRSVLLFLSVDRYPNLFIFTSPDEALMLSLFSPLPQE